LEFIDSDTLVLSSGIHGESIVGLFHVDHNKLEVNEIKSKKLSSKYFGEGSTFFDGKIYTLTWKAGKVFVYDTELKTLKEFKMPSDIKEGWGICHDHKSLYVTDSTQHYFEVDPNTFHILNKFTAKDHKGKELRALNEIDMVDD